MEFLATGAGATGAGAGPLLFSLVPRDVSAMGALTDLILGAFAAVGARTVVVVVAGVPPRSLAVPTSTGMGRGVGGGVGDGVGAAKRSEFIG